MYRSGSYSFSAYGLVHFISGSYSVSFSGC